MGKFVLHRVATGIKFDLRAANGQVIAVSEVYSGMTPCKKGVESVRSCAAAKVWDQTAEDRPVPNPRFELYRDRSENYRFRLRSRNGKIIASSEAYTTKAACFSGIESLKANAPQAETEYD